jgi:hypothetical protein
VTYEQLQTLGALAGWPRCDNDPDKDKPCGRLYNPEWPSIFSDVLSHSYCPVEAVKKGECWHSCSHMSDREWMAALRKQLRRDKAKL